VYWKESVPLTPGLGVYVTELSKLTYADPMLGEVNEVTVSGSPSGSLSLARTVMTTDPSWADWAKSSTASGGPCSGLPPGSTVSDQELSWPSWNCPVHGMFEMCSSQVPNASCPFTQASGSSGWKDPRKGGAPV
jgi:hypothetical protein